MDEIQEAREYIKKYTKSAHALILFDEAISCAALFAVAKQNILIDNCKKLDPPLTVASVRIEVDGFKKLPGKYVSVRPCGDNPDNKTYLGILLGECCMMAMGTYDKYKQEIFVHDRLNPMIFVPDLMKVVLGAESWWGEIEKPEDLKQITDADINDVWYVKALKASMQSKENKKDEKDIP